MTGNAALRLEDLPDQFPVFPLAGVLLLPGGRLPLNIFEPRYRAMTEDALGAGRMLAMIQPDPGRPAGASGPALYRIGCLGRLVAFSETEDGRYLITLAGVARFEIRSELPMRRGYRRISADYTPYAADLAPAAATTLDRAPLLTALRPYFARHGLQPNWDAIEKMPASELVTTLSMLCPFAAAEKQALLEAPGPDQRAATLLTLLTIDSHAGAADDAPLGAARTRAS